MKTFTKLFLMIALMGSIAMADGEMGNGGYQPCTVNCPPPPCTVDCGGGFALSGGSELDTINVNSASITSDDLIIELVKEYIDLYF